MEAERRILRSENTTEALCLQLDACRRAAALTGMVLADEEGITLATSGDPQACGEVAAQLPLIGQKTPTFDGVLYSAEAGWEVGMKRFRAADTELYLCAIGGLREPRSQQIQHSIGGVSRILMTS